MECWEELCNDTYLHHYYSMKVKPIYNVSRFGLMNLLSRLLEDCGSGVNELVNVKDSEGRTPLSWAARWGEKGVV